MSAARPYVVRQGDYVARLAHELGVSGEDVWGDPANRELREQREDMNVLLPGDALRVPVPRRAPIVLRAGGANAYRATVPTVSIDLVVRDSAGPLANEPCRVDGLGGGTVDRSTDGDGRIVFDVPVHIREVRLSFHEGRTIISLLVGHMDPLSEPSGVRARLANLGYLPAAGDGDADDFLTDAVREFQRHEGLVVTGEVDDETLRTLRETHRS